MKYNDDLIEYLTEGKLGDFLAKEYSDGVWVHNKQIPGGRFRPDYRNEELKMVVEYDGLYHYTIAKNVLSDVSKKETCLVMGYKHIVIPYWLQLTQNVIKMFFNKDTQDYSGGFPLGFISKTVTLPSDFCCFGIDRFIYEMSMLNACDRKGVIDSLLNKVEEKGDWRLVVPVKEMLTEEIYSRQ